jgi:hypothetical protein
VNFSLLSNSSNLWISSEIAGELNRIDAVVQDFITDIEVQNLRKAQESVPFAREKYEADRMLDMGFQDTIDRIIEKIPSRRQTLLFSRSSLAT